MELSGSILRAVFLGKPRSLIVAAGVVASGVFLYLAVRRLDFATLRATWASASLLPWIPLGVLSYVAGHVVRGMRCRLLVRRDAGLRLATASNIVVVGYASNNVFPARLGELVRAGMLAERTGMPVAQSLTITFIERVLDGLAILLLLALGTWRGGGAQGWTRDLVRAGLLVFGSASVVMLLGVFSPGVVVSGMARLGNKLGERWHDRIVSLGTSIANAGACLRDPRDALMIGLYSVLVWVLEAGLFVAILPAFGLSADPATGAVAMSVTNLGLLVPSSPGFIGPFHFFCSRALSAGGVAEPTALAYATVVHLAFYVPVTIWGAGAMLWYGVEVGATAAMARAARVARKQTTVSGVPVREIASLAPAAPELPATEFTITLCESVIVPEGARADRDVLEQVGAFVQGQLGALNPQLSFLFRAGMTFFRFLTRLRYVRGYCELSLETRRKWTHAWAQSRYALLRQLFRPVRGIALLAYYEHPKVRAALLEEEAVVVPASDLARPAGKARARSPAPAEVP